MKTDVFRLRLGRHDEDRGATVASPSWNQALHQRGWGGLPPMLLAQKLAELTKNVLVDLGPLEPARAEAKLDQFCAAVGPLHLEGRTFLQVAFEGEEELAAGVRLLQRLVNSHVWGMAHRIAPPEPFYRAHPEVKEACRSTGTVVVDASTPCTLTTASLNPLAGDVMASWLDQYFTQREQRRRFYSHAAIVPEHWPGIFRSHFEG